MSQKVDVIDVPLELVKLENHFHQPPIINNINKRKRDVMKKRLNEKQKGTQSPDGNVPTESTTRWQLHTMITQLLNDADELRHVYVEGPDMVVTDLVIFPCISYLMVSKAKFGPKQTMINRKYLPI